MQKNLPIHLQIKRYVLDEIEAGRFAPGDQLPSQRELGERFQTSHMTVRRAIDELVHEQVILAITGKGLYINEAKEEAETGPQLGFSEDMRLRGLAASSRLLRSGLEGAGAAQARALEVAVGFPLFAIQRLRLANGAPMAIQHSWVRSDLCPDLLRFDFEERSLFDVFRVEYRLRIDGGGGSVGARVATHAEAELLEMAEPAALLVSERVTRLESGAPLEFVRSSYRGDRYQMPLGR